MSVTEKVLAFNRGRDPERLEMKYARMSEDALGFYRGTAHLFYEELEGVAEGPQVWLCGDLHLENFGSYLSDNRLAYFDQNDFDEACRGPVSVDVARLLGSIVLEAEEREFGGKRVRALAEEVVDSYAEELQSGKARWLERATASGLVKELLEGTQCRGRSKFLASRTVLVGRKKKLLVNGKKALPLAEGEAEKLEKFCTRELEGFRLIDAARRIAGNGSLGVPRFVLLVEDPQGEEVLLDLKEAQKAAGLRFHDWPQPEWKSEAERVATVQGMVQAATVAFLRPVDWRGSSWVLRELLPQEQRVEVAQATDRDFLEFARTLGQVSAWSALRSSGRKGAATADELEEFGAKKKWRREVVEYALALAERTLRQWEEFKEFRASGRNSYG